MARGRKDENRPNQKSVKLGRQHSVGYKDNSVASSFIEPMSWEREMTQTTTMGRNWGGGKKSRVEKEVGIMDQKKGKRKIWQHTDPGDATKAKNFLSIDGRKIV